MAALRTSSLVGAVCDTERNAHHARSCSPSVQLVSLVEIISEFGTTMSMLSLVLISVLRTLIDLNRSGQAVVEFDVVTHPQLMLEQDDDTGHKVVDDGLQAEADAD